MGVKKRSGERTEYSFEGSSLTNWTYCSYWKPPRSWLVKSWTGLFWIAGVDWRVVPFSW